MTRLVTFLTVLLLSGWATVSAQSLVELAKKEKERRKKIDATQVKSYDESDLRSRGGTLPTTRTEVVDAGSEEEAGELEEEEEMPEEDPTQTESYWRNRLAPINKRIADIQARLNAPGFAQDPSNMIRRQRLERDLERAISERQTILDEARRKGIPSGWLRL